MHAPSISGCTSSNAQLRRLPRLEKKLRVTPDWTMDAAPSYQADGKSEVCSTHARASAGKASAMPSACKIGAASDYIVALQKIRQWKHTIRLTQRLSYKWHRQTHADTSGKACLIPL